MLITEENKQIKIVYTGDLGNKHIPILKDPTIIDYADYIIMETTYGNRLHGNLSTELQDFAKIIKDTFRKGGNVIIPSFAVGRTQEVLYTLNKYVEGNVLTGASVYVDSPLASESTAIFSKYHKYYDEEATKLLNNGDDPLSFKGLTFTRSAEESMKLNKVQSGSIIISASGMCEAGRIKHHLKHNLWRRECSIVFVGYQAEGTLGRSILDGAKKVKILGEEVAVNAKVYNLHGLSGHADQNGLIDWLEGFKAKPEKVILVHGDDNAQKGFNELLQLNGYSTFIAKPGDSFTPGILPQKFSVVRNKILSLINSIEDPDSMDKNLLLEQIKDALKNI
jgi:metallo-beta-lactamase family protein